MTGTTGESGPLPRDILANLITVHRSNNMDDSAWLTHIELADLMLQVLDVEGYVVVEVAPDTDFQPLGHEFVPVAGHPDDDECTHREDGTDATYCGQPEAAHSGRDQT
jgi:hypothetical protein